MSHDTKMTLTVDVDGMITASSRWCMIFVFTSSDQGVLFTYSLKKVKCPSPIQYIVVGLFKLSFRYHHQELQMMEPTVVLVFLMFKGNIANPLKRSHA